MRFFISLLILSLVGFTPAVSFAQDLGSSESSPAKNPQVLASDIVLVSGDVTFPVIIEGKRTKIKKTFKTSCLMPAGTIGKSRIKKNGKAKFRPYSRILARLRRQRREGDESEELLSKILRFKALVRSNLCEQAKIGDPDPTPTPVTLPTSESFTVETSEGEASTEFNFLFHSVVPEQVSVELVSVDFSDGDIAIEGTTGTISHSLFNQQAGTFSYRVVDSNGPSNVSTVTITPKSPTGEFAGDPDSLAPYRQHLSEHELTHLFLKGTFGPTAELYLQAEGKTLDEIVSYMTRDFESELWDEAMSQAERYYGRIDQSFDLDDDRGTGPGGRETKYTSDPFRFGEASFEAVSHYMMRYGDTKAKMLYIWHTHLAPTNIVNFTDYDKHDFIRDYLTSLNTFGFGNFDDFCKTWDNSIVSIALDNQLNAVSVPNSTQGPNENYGRELLELFTLGAKNQRGEDNYSQDDIIAVTRAVSGYRFVDGSSYRLINSHLNIDPPNYPGASDAPEERLLTYAIDGITFDAARRWSNPLNPTIDSVPFEGTPWEYTGSANELVHDTICDWVLYQHPEAPRYIARKLLSKFAQADASEELVEQLAEQLLSTNYDIRTAVYTILTSSAMFSEKSRYGCVTSPIEHLFRILRGADLPIYNGNGEDMFLRLREYSRDVLQDFAQVWSVFGFNECGDNRPDVNHGEGWLTEGLYLSRQQQTTLLLERYLNQKRFELPGSATNRWEALLPAARPTARQTVEYVAKLLGYEFPDNVVEKLEEYLKTFQLYTYNDDEQSTRVVEWTELDQSDFVGAVNLKMPQLIRLMAQLEGLK